MHLPPPAYIGRRRLLRTPGRAGQGLMRLFLRLLIVPVVLGLGWTVWWVVGANTQEDAIEAWLAERAAAGWQADHAAVEVTGFPARFERMVEGLVLTDPVQGWSLAAPWLAASSPSYEPSRFTVTAAPSFSFAVPGQRVEVGTGTNRFELDVAAQPSMPLDAARLAVSDLLLEAPDWSARAASLAASVAEREASAGPENSYNVSLEASDVVLPAPLIAGLDPTGRLEPRFQRLVVEGHVALDHALDRDFVEAGELSAQSIVLENAHFRWGEMALDASGRVDADARGRAEGKLELTVTNWRRMIEVAEESGLIGSKIARGIEAALGLASIFGSREGAIDVPLAFEDGRAWIGPVAVGEAPRISLPPRESVQG